MPIGADNTIEPGGPDQGQPTHFYPRRAIRFCSRSACQGFRHQRVDLDAHRARQDRKGLRLAQDRLPDRQAGDFDGSRRRFRQPARRTAHQPSTRAEGRRRCEAQRESRRRGRTGRGRARSRQPAGETRDASTADRRRPRRAAERREPALPAALVDRAGQWPRVTFLLDRLPRQRRGRHLQSRADEDVDRHARLRELAVVAALFDSRAAGRQPVDCSRDLPGAG